MLSPHEAGRDSWRQRYGVFARSCLNPLDFLKYTPRSNCGSCGHPTCLAFAVAVTRGGAEPGLCPFIDPAGLPAAGTGPAAPADGRDERDTDLVARLKSKILHLDLRTIATRVGADWLPEQSGLLRFRYLGRQVQLGKAGLRLDGRETTDPRDRILLYSYMSCEGGRVPAGDWIGMESLPNSLSKVRTLETYCELRLAGRFGGRSQRLAELCRRLGAEPVPGGRTATVGVVVPVLPYVPHCLLFWDEEPEDGFEARVKILFDRHVMDFLDIESLVFSAERLADRLAELDL